MIWDLIIIIAIVVIIIILARRIPIARNLQKKESPDVSPEEMTMFGLLSNADDAFDRRDFEKAEKLYIKAAATAPKNAKIYNRLGAIYLENKNYYDAKESFLQSVKLDESKASHHVNLGLAYIGLKDYFKAEKAFSDALKLDPKNKKYQNLLEKAKNKK